MGLLAKTFPALVIVILIVTAGFLFTSSFVFDNNLPAISRTVNSTSWSQELNATYTEMHETTKTITNSNNPLLQSVISVPSGINVAVGIMVASIDIPIRMIDSFGLLLGQEFPILGSAIALLVAGLGFLAIGRIFFAGLAAWLRWDL